jgi:hypothetical protein
MSSRSGAHEEAKMGETKSSKPVAVAKMGSAGPENVAAILDRQKDAVISDWLTRGGEGGRSGERSSDV